MTTELPSSQEFEGFTHFGAAGVQGEGAYTYIWLLVEDGVIRKAAYRSNSCPSAMAAGAMAATLLTGMPVEKALLMTAEDLILIMGGLPEGREECAVRTIQTVREALESGKR